MRSVLFHFYRGGNQGLSRLGNMANVTQLSGKIGMKLSKLILTALFEHLCSSLC